MFCREILPDFLAAFKVLVRASMSADVLRSLSLFITYALHKHSPIRPLRVKRSNVQLERSSTINVARMDPGLRNVDQAGIGGGLVTKEVNFTRQQVGTAMLGMYHDFLFEEGNGIANIKKFARTVTNKVSFWPSILLKYM